MINKLKNVVFNVIYILLLIYLFIFIPTIFGKKPLVIISGSMEPTLKVGGILYYEEIDINDFNKGNILVYQINNHTVSHRIVEKTKEGFITKGDNNTSIDTYEVYNEQVIGKGTNWSIPFLGYYADYIYHHKYFIIIAIGLISIDLYLENTNRRDGNEKIN